MSENKGIQIWGSVFNAEQIVAGDQAQAYKDIHAAQPPVPEQRQPIKVLLVFANPRGSDRLFLDLEDRMLGKILVHLRDNAGFHVRVKCEP